MNDEQNIKKNELKICVVGIGGAGLNVLDKFVERERDVKTIAIDTNVYALENSNASEKIRLGNEDTKFGTGGDTELGKEVSLASYKELEALVKNLDILFVVGGLGGGTATMAIPLLVKIAAETPSLFVATFCSTPLGLEGEEKKSLALKAFQYARKRANIAVELPNSALLADMSAPVEETFAKADWAVANAVADLIDSLTKRGIVNIDVANFRRTFAERGRETLFAIAEADGENHVADALEKLFKSPFLKNTQNKADALLINLKCPQGFQMNKMQQILESVSAQFSNGRRVSFGASINDSTTDKISLFALGVLPFDTKKNTAWQTPPQTKQAEVPAPTFANSAEEKSPETAPIQQETQTKKYFQTKQEELKKPTIAPSKNTSQEQSEFEFVGRDLQRGFFEDTTPNIRNAEDLDVPTFMRKNIKIQL